MLVYDYGKRFTLLPSTTLEEYMENPTPLGDDSKTEALQLLCKRTPHGIVKMFLDDKITDLQAGVTISDERKKIYVVFRGSESLTDWMYDFKVFKRDLGDGIKVHGGFYKQLFKTNAYEKIKEVIHALYNDDQYKCYELVITGHSLGASLATLFGYLICKTLDSTPVTVVSFASPRVGNDQWRKAFDLQPNLKHYRISNQRDIITVCPFFNYYHVGTNICLSDERVSIELEYPLYEKTIFNCWSIKEHFCDLYFDRLLKHSW
jgi:hypothetical protein